MYKCLQCKVESTQDEWNETTQNDFTTTITPIQHDIDNLSFYVCPGCGVYISHDEIEKI